MNNHAPLKKPAKKGVIEAVLYLCAAAALAFSLVLLRGIGLYECDLYDSDFFNASPTRYVSAFYNLRDSINFSSSSIERVLSMLPTNWEDCNLGYQLYDGDTLLKEQMFPHLENPAYTEVSSETFGEQDRYVLHFYMLQPLQYPVNNIDGLALAKENYDYYNAARGWAPALLILSALVVAALLVKRTMLDYLVTSWARYFAYWALALGVFLLSLLVFYHPHTAAMFYWEVWSPYSFVTLSFALVVLLALAFAYFIFPVICPFAGQGPSALFREEIKAGYKTLGYIQYNGRKYAVIRSVPVEVVCRVETAKGGSQKYYAEADDATVDTVYKMYREQAGDSYRFQD